MKNKPFKSGQATKVIDCFHQGARDRRDGKPYTPPKYKAGRKAYKNGYYSL